MSTEVQSAADWLEQAAVPEASLTPAQQQGLHTAFGFLQEAGTDYYSRRFLSHFLLHCRAGLKTAAVARLCGFSRSSAGDHPGLSPKEVVQDVRKGSCREKGETSGAPGTLKKK